ncbi:Stress-induced-phospho 1 [Lecanosticta acicola]|uniref:Stress-induced-phospho 1 n=1 Tax=Lecanosticta acicola TaxID=111012 RepID=A0AAI9E7X4_9PEZI|nr:Stress-induced-phospho 1 [Lecanosticta acicola]
MSSTDLQRQGRDCYKRQEYDKALQLFNRAVGRGDPTPQLLDNLAATHDKLNDLPSALKAAKKAIQAGREDATGYLRAGIILKKMEKPSVALEIYAHALKSIKHVGQGFEQLKKVHDELQQQIAPNNSVDPLTVLPRELANTVLEYLSFRQRIAICRVSKGWRHFIRSEPSLWSHLDLSAAKSKVGTKFVSTVMNTARGKLKVATLNRLYDFDKVLAAVVPRIESLTLTGTGLQGENLVRALRKTSSLRELRILQGTDISPHTLRELIPLQPNLEVLHCTTLKHVSFDDTWNLELPNLLSLNLTAKTMLGLEVCFQKLSGHASKLEDLTFWEQDGGNAFTRNVDVDLRSFPNLKRLLLRSPLRDVDQIQLPPNLTSLTLQRSRLGSTSGLHFITNTAPNVLNEFFIFNLPALEELSLHMPGLLLSDITQQWSVTKRPNHEAPKLSKLKSLSMYQPQCGTLSVPPRLAELDRLSLLDCYSLNDEYVETILHEFKNLRYLDVSGSSITGVGVRDIVKAGHIQELVVCDCQKLGRDAVDWARSQGLKVEYRINNIDSGKRLKFPA